MATKLSNKYTAILRDYLMDHEHQIAIEENDYGDLLPLFKKIIGRDPE